VLSVKTSAGVEVEVVCGRGDFVFLENNCVSIMGYFDFGELPE